jgi:hypothetical protein
LFFGVTPLFMGNEMSKEFDYDADLSIDQSALDAEWLDQPRLMMRYAENSVLCRMRMDEAKEELELVRAKLDKRIREFPEDYGVGKLTESVVQSCILMDEGYQEAPAKLSRARYDSDLAKAAVSAVEQRRDALENLVRLFGLQYFAGPRSPRDLEEVVRQRQQESDARVAARIRRRAE